VTTGANFQTSDERVFAIGDSAIIDQGDQPAPPTAQAAWQAAEVAGENIARAIENRPLKTWGTRGQGNRHLRRREGRRPRRQARLRHLAARRHLRRLPGEEPEEDDRRPLDRGHHLWNVARKSWSSL